MKKILLLNILLYSTTFFSQEKRTFFQGKITNFTTSLENVNVLNLNTKQGTYSNAEGLFKILAKQNDSLRISSIGYASKIYKVTNVNSNVVKIELEAMNFVLEEVLIKNHNLSGSLDLDINKVPEDKVAILMNDFTTRLNKDLEYLRSKEKGWLQLSLTGVKATFPKSNKKQQIRNEILFKERFPKRLLAILGEDFFFNQLKIPKENYYHFLDYCSYKNTENLYKNENFLELIRIFQEESISYHEIIKKQD
ncbi:MULTISPECIES: carboxypeptidase-like regulatory domain-containing protein [Tenacibaculum]|uniref:carboxypeptidase-like regulatory domain-containing protein n=1 Tax=Tenacibaculum TaxID=104267 RepID=UPI001F0A1D69|nr:MULTISPECIES: carboxypeptidase-like regulatory domain-containing protein [Tenacibaculum]MCH3882728.1 carboxypeptidase-like regulatory domain-containing protein [Tenacibaculum aquimarinum]MDO6600241.1 carboxypeptidase-like regulatory domain-containing protein [Tenacibaculum sp. 1_MG-2023]